MMSLCSPLSFVPSPSFATQEGLPCNMLRAGVSRTTPWIACRSALTKGGQGRGHLAARALSTIPTSPADIKANEDLKSTHDNHAMLRSDVKTLGRMLGDAIRVHSGDDVFNKVRTIDFDVQIFNEGCNRIASSIRIHPFICVFLTAENEASD